MPLNPTNQPNQYRIPSLSQVKFAFGRIIRCYKLRLVWFGLVWLGFFVYWHINLRGLFSVKANLLEQQRNYLTHTWVGNEIHTSPKIIVQKWTL